MKLIINTPWILLLIAGLFEIAWVLGLKYSEGFSRIVPSLLTIVGMFFSFIFLSKALQSIPLGTAYAVWTGIGAAGTAILGIILFQESMDIWRVLCIALIIVGIIGLKLVSGE